MITYDDFKKVELKTAKILKAERVEGSEKLIVLEIDLGAETRPLVAGVGRSYNPQDLVGKTVVVVANLEPKTLMGHESRGMLLGLADENDNPVLLVPDKPVPPGQEVR